MQVDKKSISTSVSKYYDETDTNVRKNELESRHDLGPGFSVALHSQDSAPRYSRE